MNRQGQGNNRSVGAALVAALRFFANHPNRKEN